MANDSTRVDQVRLNIFFLEPGITLQNNFGRVDLVIITVIGRYWHTLRYLRLVQFWGRLWFYLYQPKPDLTPSPPLSETTASWFSCPHFPSMLGVFGSLLHPGDHWLVCHWVGIPVLVYTAILFRSIDWVSPVSLGTRWC